MKLSNADLFATQTLAIAIVVTQLYPKKTS